MSDFGVVHHFPTEGNPVYIRQMHLPAGHFVNTHEHKFDHFGILGKGKAIVEINGMKTMHAAPCVIEIKAGMKHKITAMEDITWFCLHHVQDFDLETVDEVLIKGN